MGEAQIFLFFLVINLGVQAESFSGGVGRGEDMGWKGLAGARLLQVVLTAAGYSHDRTQQTSRLGSLEDVGLHQAPGDGSLAVLQAAVRGRAANAWGQGGYVGIRTLTEPGHLPSLRGAQHSTAG